MSHDSRTDPCREWLGIDAVELANPWRVLDIPPEETSPVAIARAADKRLKMLRGIDPGSLEVARDAIIRRVEESRDELLSKVSAASATDWGADDSTGTPFAPAGQAPVSPLAAPPPTPAPAGAAGAEGPAELIDFQPRLTGGRRRPPVSALPATLSLLCLAVAGIAAYVVWPRRPASDPAPPLPIVAEDRAEALVQERPEPTTTPPLTGAVVTPPAPPEGGDRASDRIALRTPAPDVFPPEADQFPPVAEPESAASEAYPPIEEPPPTAPEQPAATAEPVPFDPPRAPAPPAAGKAANKIVLLLRTALSEIQRNDFAAARKELDAARKLAAGDSALERRVAGWRQFADLAEEYVGQRKLALQNFGQARDLEVGDVRISVIEVTPQQFVYRHAGRNSRVPHEKIPEPIVQAIVNARFAADGRPVNHLYVGARQLARPRMDLQAARSAWAKARAAGEDTSLLEPLLQDPLIVGAAEAAKANWGRR